MEEVLRQMKTVPGVLGCMVCDDQGHLVSHVFPSLFDREMLSAAITTVSQNLPGLQDFTGGVKMIDFRFQSGRLVVKPLDGACLVILCEAMVSLQALIISVNVAVKQLEKSLKSATPLSPQVPATPKTAPVRAASPGELLEAGPLSTCLQGMQANLALFLGPMSRIIFLECLATWLQDHQPVSAALPRLVDIVVAEIGDPAKMTDYRHKVAPLILT